MMRQLTGSYLIVINKPFRSRHFDEEKDTVGINNIINGPFVFKCSTGSWGWANVSNTRSLQLKQLDIIQPLLATTHIIVFFFYNIQCIPLSNLSISSLFRSLLSMTDLKSVINNCGSFILLPSTLLHCASFIHSFSAVWKPIQHLGDKNNRVMKGRNQHETQYMHGLHRHFSSVQMRFAHEKMIES